MVDVALAAGCTNCGGEQPVLLQLPGPMAACQCQLCLTSGNASLNWLVSLDACTSSCSPSAGLHRQQPKLALLCTSGGFFWRRFRLSTALLSHGMYFGVMTVRSRTCMSGLHVTHAVCCACRQLRMRRRRAHAQTAKGQPRPCGSPLSTCTEPRASACLVQASDVD